MMMKKYVVIFNVDVDGWFIKVENVVLIVLYIFKDVVIEKVK